MLTLFVSNPWLVPCVLVAGVIVACTAIVFITDYLRTSHQAQIDASLKEDMLERGMSAADIKTVLEARTDGEAARLALSGNQGVRVGLGKFQVEVGGVNNSASATPVSPAAHV
jgi:hypothetical protein